MKAVLKSTPVTSVDDYLHALPEKEHKVLEKLRQTIRSVVPNAEEVISYQIPTFKYNGGLVGFAAFKDHCSFFAMSSTILQQFSEELKGFKTATGTIQFGADKPIPAALIRKIVQARIKENEAVLLAKKDKKAVTKKTTATKLTDAEKVTQYMTALEHPFKDAIEATRTIIKNADSQIAERIKWNGPSYYYKAVQPGTSGSYAEEDFVTFNLRATKHLHLVFHHPLIVQIQSALLEGAYKDRRMAYFQDMADVQVKKKELERIIRQMTQLLEKKQ